MSEVKNVIGDRVRNARIAKGWSQEELATQCQLAGWDISRATLSKIEAKLRRVVDSELFVLASVLKVKIPELFPAKKTILSSLRD